VRHVLLPTLALAISTANGLAQPTSLSRERLRESLPADGVIQPLGVQPQWVERTGPGVYWRRTSPTNVHAPYYALHFAGFRSDPEADWRLRIEDGRGTELLALGPSDHRAGDFWTHDLVADGLVFVVESDRPPTGLSFTIDRWLIGDQKPAIRSLLVPGDPKLEPILRYRNDPSVWTPSRAVAKLSIRGATERYSCTGFLIGADLLLTNEHCIPEALAVRTPGVCRDVIEVLFNYDGDGAPPSPYVCTEIVETNAGLDYGILRLAGDPGHRLGILRLEASRGPRSRDTTDPLRIIQHPGGRPKSVTIQRCRADRVGVPGVENGGVDQDFEHVCDTEGGSSGSPVLDGAGKVVGLHHFGFLDDAVVRRNQAVLMPRIVASFPNDVKAALVP